MIEDQPRLKEKNYDQQQPIAPVSDVPANNDNELKLVDEPTVSLCEQQKSTDCSMLMRNINNNNNTIINSTEKNNSSCSSGTSDIVNGTCETNTSYENHQSQDLITTTEQLQQKRLKEEESISCNNSNDSNNTHRSQSSNSSPSGNEQQQNEEHHRAPTSNSSQSGGSINGDQMHTCKLCDKQLSSSSSLDRHMLTHSGERPFKCKRCSMTFTTNGNMHRHMRTHLHKDSLAQQKQSLATTTVQHQQQAITSSVLPSSIISGNSRLSSKSDQQQHDSVNGEQKQQQIRQRRRKIRSVTTGSNVKEDLDPNDCYDDDATIISSDNDSGCNEDNLLLPTVRTPPIKKRKQNHPSYKGSQAKNDLNEGPSETSTDLEFSSSHCPALSNDLAMMKDDQAPIPTREQATQDRERFLLKSDNNTGASNNVVRSSSSEGDVDDDRSESNLTRSDEGGEHDNIETKPIPGSNCDQSISGIGHNMKKNFDENLLSILNYKPLKCFFASDNNYTQINEFHDLNTKEHFHTLMSDEATKMQLASMVAAAAQINNPFIHGSNNLNDQAANKIREQQLQFATQMLKNFTDSSIRHGPNEFYCYPCKLTFPSRELSDKHFKSTHLGNIQNYGQSTTSRKPLSSDQLCSQTDLPWPSSTVMAAATAAALANIQSLPSTLPASVGINEHMHPRSGDDLDQHASPSISPQSQLDNGIEYSKNIFINGSSKRKHTTLCRKTNVQEEEPTIFPTQNRHMLNQKISSEGFSSGLNDSTRGSPQLKRSDSSSERVLWVRSDSQYSQRSANEDENDFAAKDEANAYSSNCEAFDDLLSNSSRSMSKFEDDNNNDHHLHKTKDPSVSARPQITSSKDRQNLEDHNTKTIARKQQAAATCFPQNPSNVSETGSAYYNKPTKPVTESTEEIGQNYVKTANPNATRKGGKRNRHCYKCKLCTYSSVDRCTLVRHLRIHSGERPYICMICRYAFTTKANCERHVRKRHKKQYNSLGGSGDGVKGSNSGGRSLIITDHSNHQTIPVKVSSTPNPSGQSHKTPQGSHGSTSSRAPNTSARISSNSQTNIKNNHNTYDSQSKLTTKGSHQSSNHNGSSKQSRKSTQHNNDSLPNQVRHDRASDSLVTGGFKLDERGNARTDRNHVSTTIKNHQTLQDQCLSLSTSPSSHLILNFDHFSQKHQQQSHPLQFVNNESQRLRLPFDTHRPLDLAAQALDLSCKFQPGR